MGYPSHMTNNTTAPVDLNAALAALESEMHLLGHRPNIWILDEIDVLDPLREMTDQEIDDEIAEFHLWLEDQVFAHEYSRGF